VSSLLSLLRILLRLRRLLLNWVIFCGLDGVECVSYERLGLKQKYLYLLEDYQCSSSSLIMSRILGHVFSEVLRYYNVEISFRLHFLHGGCPTALPATILVSVQSIRDPFHSIALKFNPSQTKCSAGQINILCGCECTNPVNC